MAELAAGWEPPSPRVDQKIWGGVTDPAHHDDENPSSYRYLVHSFNPAARSGLRRLLTATYKKNQEGNQAVDLYEWPELLNERVSLSCSLVDAAHSATWGDVGLIIEAPTQNIVLTALGDAKTNNNRISALQNQATNHTLMTGDQLIANTSSSPFDYNEVVVLAASAANQGNPLRLRGFFVKADAPAALAQRMLLHAQRLGLPIVEIVDINPYATDELLIKNSRVAANVGGRHFVLDSSDDSRFMVFQGKEGSFASPDDLKPVWKFLARNGFDDAVVEEYKNCYAEADRKRQTPTVEFSANGAIKNVSTIEGYGPHETRYRVESSGHAYLWNVSAYNEYITETLMHTGRMPSTAGVRQALSPQRAIALVDEAVKHCSEEQHPVIAKWRKKIIPRLERQWRRGQRQNRRFPSDLPHTDYHNFPLHAAENRIPGTPKRAYL